MSKIDMTSVIAEVVKQALSTEAHKTSTTMEPSDVNKVAPPVANKVEKAVKKEVQAMVDHATNQEPWYQSRVTWGAIVAAIAGTAGIVGYSIDAEDQKFWVDSITQGIQLATAIGSLVGGVIAWYGRWRAKKPIGQ